MLQQTSSPYPRVDRAILEFSSRIDSIRQDLYYCDVNFARGRAREIGRSIRASAYVYAAAAVEYVVSEFLAATLAEITATTVEIRKVRLSMFALFQAPLLDSLQQLRGLKMWVKRSEVFGDINAQAICALDGTILPLDGKTIRPQHLEAIWQVFGFSANALPDPRSRLALHELADARNDVAHGDVPPTTVGGQTSVTDMLKLLDRIESIITNMWTEIYDYLTNKKYLRT